MPPQRKKPGPKPKIGPDEQKQVLGALGVGGSLADAAGLIGVNPSTLRRLKAADPEFARGVRHAVRAGKLKLIQKVANAPAWQAAAWMLERKWGREFGKKDKLDLTNHGESAFTFNISSSETTPQTAQSQRLGVRPPGALPEAN